MTKKFSYKIKKTKRVAFIWIFLNPAIFLILYKNNYINFSILFLNISIALLYYSHAIKFIKSTGLLYSVIYSYNASQYIKHNIVEDKDSFDSVEFKDLIDSIKLTASVWYSSFLSSFGISHLIYTYKEYNLLNVISTYTLTLILILLLARHSDKRYIKLYNLRIKVKKVIVEYD